MSSGPVGPTDGTGVGDADGSIRSAESTLVLGDGDIARALTRIAHEILERNRGAADVVLLGIPTRGLPLARRLGERLAAAEPGIDAARITGSLDVSMQVVPVHRHVE